MSKLDPVILFRTLCKDIPQDLRRDVFVTGSLAAAYAFKVRLAGQAINTKDADLLIHPAGNVDSARKMAERLLAMGWRPTDQCKPLAEMPDDVEQLWAIRLMPPGSSDYFIEFLNVPVEEQAAIKLWIPVQLNGGWYGLPSFKFMGLLTWFRRASDEGLEYAAQRHGYRRFGAARHRRTTAGGCGRAAGTACRPIVASSWGALRTR
jgi:hypothetical protein